MTLPRFPGSAIPHAWSVEKVKDHDRMAKYQKLDLGVTLGMNVKTDMRGLKIGTPKKMKLLDEDEDLFPKGMTDEEKGRFKQAFIIFNSDRSAFMASAATEMAKDPALLDRMKAAVRERGIMEAAANVANCDGLDSLSDADMASIMSIPYGDLSTIMQTARELQNRGMTVDADTVAEIRKQAVVMRVMEAGRSADDEGLEEASESMPP